MNLIKSKQIDAEQIAKLSKRLEKGRRRGMSDLKSWVLEYLLNSVWWWCRSSSQRDGLRRGWCDGLGPGWSTGCGGAALLLFEVLSTCVPSSPERAGTGGMGAGAVGVERRHGWRRGTGCDGDWRLRWWCTSAARGGADGSCTGVWVQPVVLRGTAGVGSVEDRCDAAAGRARDADG